MKVLISILIAALCLSVACGAKKVSYREIGSVYIGKQPSKASGRRIPKNLSREKWDRIIKETDKFMKKNERFHGAKFKAHNYSYSITEDDTRYIVTYYSKYGGGMEGVEIFLSKDTLEIITSVSWI